MKTYAERAAAVKAMREGRREKEVAGFKKRAEAEYGEDPRHI